MKKIMTLAFVGLLAVSMAACGSSKDKAENKVLTVGTNELTGTFSPIYYSTKYDGYAVSMVYQQLLSYDANNKLQSSLAKSYDISKDSKTFTFHLDENATFSDGTALTADDVAFTFKAVSDPSYTGRYGSTVQNLVGYDEYSKKGNKEEPAYPGIKVIDKHTIQLTVKEVRSDNLINLSTSIAIMSKNQFKDYKYGNTKPMEQAATEKPIGSGPYMLKDWKKGSGAAFVKNPYYKGEGYKIKNVIIKPVTQTTLYPELEKGNINVAGTADPKVIAPASKNPKLAMNVYADSSISYIALNTINGATADKTVRQALAYSYNRKAINDSYFECKDCKIDGSIAYTPTTLNNPASALGDIISGKQKLEGLESYDYNMDKAKKLLDDDGWKMGSNGIRMKDGKNLTVKLMISQDSKFGETTINVLNKDWKQELGVDLQVATVDFNTLVSKVTSNASEKEWNGFMMGVSFSTDSKSDLMTMIDSKYIGDGQDNYARLNDPKLDSLLDSALKEMDEKKAFSIWEKAQIQLNEDAAYIANNGSNAYYFYDKNLKNFKTSALHNWVAALKDATFE